MLSEPSVGTARPARYAMERPTASPFWRARCDEYPGVERAAAIDITTGVPVFERLNDDGGPVAMTLLEFGQRAFERDGPSFDGASVLLTGFVAGTEPGGFQLARNLIACCAADAAPVVIRVVGVHGGVPPLDQWVTVIGRFEHGGGHVPQLVATDVTPIVPPDEPYE